MQKLPTSACGYNMSQRTSSAPFGISGSIAFRNCQLAAVQICTLAQYGPSRWLSAWNIIDICTYFFQILISIAYFGRFVSSCPALRAHVSSNKTQGTYAIVWRHESLLLS